MAIYFFATFTTFIANQIEEAAFPIPSISAHDCSTIGENPNGVSSGDWSVLLWRGVKNGYSG